jgi:hypothetical protein
MSRVGPRRLTRDIVPISFLSSARAKPIEFFSPLNARAWLDNSRQVLISSDLILGAPGTLPQFKTSNDGITNPFDRFIGQRRVDRQA